MPDYRHNRVPGRSYLFTVRRPFHIDAWVVLHSHVHSIWTLPPGDHDHASRCRAIKIAFSTAARSGARQAVWHLHANPVSHGLCRQAHEWPWSSVHRFRAAGWIDRA